MVFQSFNLFPHLTVLENISRPPIVVKGVPRAEAEARACELLAGMLTPPRKRMPDLQMSPAVLGLAMNAGGAGGLRRDFGFAGSHFPIEKNFNPAALTTKLALQAQQD